jgi:hypothetical protein
MVRAENWIITHGGRNFTATAEMARIFRRQAERIVEAGDPELVVLRHSNGVDMVLITRETPYSVTKVSVARLGHASSTA